MRHFGGCKSENSVCLIFGQLETDVEKSSQRGCEVQLTRLSRKQREILVIVSSPLRVGERFFTAEVEEGIAD